MNTTTEEVLNRIRISEVYAALGGPKPRAMRGPAFWRNGDGFNVSMDNTRGVWHDFTTDEGGGVLDLVVRVRGGGRADALRWLADLVGVPLEDEPLSGQDRERWARERRELERDLPAARYWRRGVLPLLESVLDTEKGKLFDPTEGPADTFLIRDYTRIIERLNRAGDETLVREYRKWRAEMPQQCAGFVQWARDRELAEIRALLAYMDSLEAGE